MTDRPDTSDPEIPRWVGYITFALCWALGGFLIVAAGLAGTADRNLLVLGFLLVVFPLLALHGAIPAIIKRIGGGK